MTSDAENAEHLSQIVRLFSARQWCLATSGNFSFRSRNGNCLITESGKDKSRLTSDDFLLCNLRGKATRPLAPPRKK